MYSIMHNIFVDKTGGDVFNCFGPWHFFYLFLAIAVIALSIFLFRNKDQVVRDRMLKIFIAIPFTLYMLDFFLMPFAYGEIDVDKLPFHVCTLMSIMCFLSNHVAFLKKYRVNFAILAFFSNLMYLAYPSGVMSYEIHPLSYRAVQTLLFHGAMVVYGVLTLVWNREELIFKRWYRNLAVLGALTVWAMIGNGLYSGEADGYSHDFNWFFIKADPFGLIPEEIALYICPWLNIAVFFALEMIIVAIFTAFRRSAAKKAEQTA